MTSTMRLGATSAVLLAVVALGGCGSDDKTITTPDGTVKIDGDGDGATVKTKDGEFTVGKGLPEGFPSDEVPVIEGDVLSGGKGDSSVNAWAVVIKASGTTEEVAAKASKLLTDAGFKVAQPGTTAGGAIIALLGNDKYQVSVTAFEAAGTVAVSYAITDAPPSS